jgi:tellurite resistance protein
MDFPMLTPNELPFALRAWAMVSRADGATTAAEDRLLEVIARLHDLEIHAADLEPIEPDEVARRIKSPHAAKRVVQLAILVAMTNGDVSEARETAVRRLAAALGIDERRLRVLHELARGHRALAGLDMRRRLFGKLGGDAFRDGGLAGLRDFFAPIVFKDREDEATAKRYRALGDLPEGTFGRAYFDWARARGFGLPGEKGGLPERALFHDLGHVLAGYDTDARGEIQQGAFQAGFVRKDGFMFLMFVVMHFHLGVKIAPVAEAETGLFDVDLVMRALARGSRCKVDLSDHFDFWKVAHEPLESVRRELGVDPLA